MRTIGVVLTVASLALVGCGESDPGGSTSDDTGGADDAVQEAIEQVEEADLVSMTGESEVTDVAVDNNFKPPYFEVSKGTKVEFVNEGRNDHNVLPVKEGSFEPIETSEFEPGETGTVTFDEPGIYPFYCSIHGTKTKGMVGGIRVVE